MKKPRTFAIVTAICVLISASFLFSVLLFTWKNQDYAGGNHSFLFGTPWERMFRYKTLLTILSGAPLFVPLLMRRTVFTAGLCVCGVVLSYYVCGVLVEIAD